MKDILWKGSEELVTGIAGVLAIAIASAIINMVFGGWKGLLHFIGIFCTCFVFALGANWGCLHYALPLYLSALIIMVSSILSFSVLSILFDPAIRKACVDRICGEVRKRGRSHKDNEESEK